MSKREEFRNLAQQKAAMRAALASAPTGTLVKSLAHNALPETMGEAIVEGSIAVVGGVGTFIAVGTVMPAVLAAGGAVVAAAAYNAKVHDDGEIRELLGRVKKFAWPGKKNEVGDEPPQSDGRDETIRELEKTISLMNLNHKRELVGTAEVIQQLHSVVHSLKAELASMKSAPKEEPKKEEPKVIVDMELPVEEAPPLETEDPQNLDVAQWAKEGEVK